jgi:hypothetical protein
MSADFLVSRRLAAGLLLVFAGCFTLCIVGRLP